jgi:hypothetical protein
MSQHCSSEDRGGLKLEASLCHSLPLDGLVFILTIIIKNHDTQTGLDKHVVEWRCLFKDPLNI